LLRVHLDAAAAELAFAPFDRIGSWARPAARYVGIILALNAGLIAGSKGKLSTLTQVCGDARACTRLHHGLMAMVSVTAVGAFDAVGAVLVARW
jgi:manganese/zinc/iron transport system permease protein